jgi:hypothetical protein
MSTTTEDFIDPFQQQSGRSRNPSETPLLPPGEVDSYTRRPSWTSPPSPTFPFRRVSGSKRPVSPLLGPVLRRGWKLVLALSLPLLLIILYSLLLDRVDGLPSLPKISVHYDYSGNPGWVSAAAGASGLGGASALAQGTGGGRCTCGATDDGKRMCDVYGAEGLERSRLVQGSGARMKRMLARAQAGKDIKIGVLGGSGEQPRAKLDGTRLITSSVGVSRSAPSDRRVPQGRQGWRGVLYHARNGLVRKDFPAVKGGVEQWRSWRDGFEVSCSSCNLVMTDTSSYHSFCGVRGGFPRQHSKLKRTFRHTI